MPTYTFNVYDNGRWIDTLFTQETDPKEVRRSLINHDGYSDTIRVRACWEDRLIIQGNYGQGWEDESEYGPGEYANARSDLKEYRMAAPEYGHRLITRKVQV
jgi:hypothetical protein